MSRPFRSPQPNALAPRRGFSMAELLITIVIAGIVTSLAATPLKRMRDAYAVRAARQELTATIEAARSAAVQRGRVSRFVVRPSLNAVRAFVDTAGAGQPTAGTFTVLAPQPFDAAYGVTITLRTAADSLVTYGPRGLASPAFTRAAGAYVRVILTKGTAKDSVCISNLGQLLRNGCAP